MRVSIAVSVVSLALLAAEMPKGQDGPLRKTEKTRAARRIRKWRQFRIHNRKVVPHQCKALKVAANFDLLPWTKLVRVRPGVKEKRQIAQIYSDREQS
jgi:hypothetical protein